MGPFFSFAFAFALDFVFDFDFAFVFDFALDFFLLTCLSLKLLLLLLTYGLSTGLYTQLVYKPVGNSATFDSTGGSMPKIPAPPEVLLPLIRTAYDGVRDSPTVICTEDRTRQSDAADCDIRNIMSRYEQTGVLPIGRDLSEQQYVDNASAPTYEDTARAVADMRGFFSELPDAVRERFGTAAGLLDAVSNAEGDTPEALALRAELSRIGILTDLTPAEKSDTRARHSAQLDKAVPTDGSTNATQTDGKVSKPE